MGSKVNKVGSGEQKKEKKDKKEKGRVDFPLSEAMYTDKDGNIVTAVNDDELLIAVPVPIKDGDGKVVYAGYNSRKYLPLKKSNFASISDYLRYQAYISRIKAIVLIKSAEDKESKANRIEQFGDESTRRKAQKVARMREQLAALETQLTEDGVDITKL